MIASLTGTVVSKSPSQVVIDVGGVGYEVAMPGTAIVGLPPVGQRATVLTHMHVREDEISLFGFSSVADKDVFRALIAISGVGPKLALAVLSVMDPSRLADAVAREDVTAICEVPGVGKKLAQRLIIELRDKLAVPELVGALAGGAPAAGPSAVEARQALVGMGFTTSEAAASLAGAPDGASVAQLITYALKRIGTGT